MFEAKRNSACVQRQGENLQHGKTLSAESDRALTEILAHNNRKYTILYRIQKYIKYTFKVVMKYIDICPQWLPVLPTILEYC